MKPFLLELAEKIQRTHPRLEGLTFIFPNRRAALYFRRHLASLLDRPAFSPRMITIEDFINSYSELQVPDKLELVHRLYRSYQTVFDKQQETDTNQESFDQFYFWGDMLLRDFEEVDKYMVNAEQLFKDLSNQKELDAAFDFLTEQQADFLKSFWGKFNDDLSENKRKFLSVWRHLNDVYRTFRKQLMKDGKAYEGMLHRAVAERFQSNEIPKSENDDMLIFAGFNALTKTEEIIISSFVERGLAEVHWDLDNYYFNNNTQEAGVFFRQYQHKAALARTFKEDVPSNFNSKKSVKIYGAAQTIGQTKLMAQILKEQLKGGIVPEDTLIVLPDEKLLLPVLHGISGAVEKLNVTMGFPLASTPMFNLIEYLIELQAGRREESFNHRHVTAILGHPYVVAADPVSSNSRRREIIEKNQIMIHESEWESGPALYTLIFKSVTPDQLLGYLREIVKEVGSIPFLTTLDQEYAFHFLKLINRLEDVIGADIGSMGATESAKQFQQALKSFIRLFRQLIRTQKIPFTGEPLKGLQVMGVLETRNLDYRNVFVLSLNEGALPSGGNKSSYIPFNIRKAYSLPTAEHQDAMYAYLFYRVLQRAENIFLFYNTETDTLGQGEMSRYLQQIIAESGWNPERRVLHNTIQPHAVMPIEIKKDEGVLEKLAMLNESSTRRKGISPSALSTYLDCQLKFYFQQIAKIREAKEVEEDLDARMLGNILHDVMERFYNRIVDKKKTNFIEASDFANHQGVTSQLIDQVFISTYELDASKEVVYGGQGLLVREVVKSMVERILMHDQKYAPFTLEGLEREGLLYYTTISHTPGQAVLGGKIDRLDRKGDMVRVIDYKTGKGDLKFESIESLFTRDEARNKAAFQTMLYALLYKTNYPDAGLKIVPGLISRVNVFEDKLDFGLLMNKVLIEDAGPLMKEFEDRLKILLEEIFNPAETFKQTDILKTCEYCPYSGICYR